MAPRNKPAWKEKGKGSGVSPKELEWQEKQQRSNLENNAAVRKKRVEARKVQSDLEVPAEVAEWFDRTRVALMALAEDEKAKKKKSGEDPALTEAGGGLGTLTTSSYRSYLQAKFEKRGLILFSIFNQVDKIRGRKGEESMGLTLARKIVQQELCGGIMGDGSDGSVFPALRLVSIGGGAGTDVAGTLWASRYFFRSRPIDAAVFEGDAKWYKHVNSTKTLLDKAKLLPACTTEFEVCQTGKPLRGGGLATGEDKKFLEGPAEGGGGGGGGGELVYDEEEWRRAAAEMAAEEIRRHAGPNVKACQMIFPSDGGGAPVDLFVISYALFERIEEHRASGMEFFKQLALGAKQGAIFIISDVLHRSREAMDELHEAMLSALEAARPKADQKADKLTIEEVMGMSEADLQATLLSTGPSHQAVMRRFRQLSLGVHPDKNLEDERAQGAFGRLQTAKDDIIRGHEVEQADDGSTVIKPLALNNYGDERMDSPTGLLLRFDVPPDDSIRAEVMVLVKGPWKPTAKPKNRRGGGGDEQEAKGGVDEKEATE